ncbi:RNA polymerase sigma factor SigM [Knoellia flava TL1]|uniref:RNA polymerase sigma factor SigM n=2 Tax=Knoellia flava TaxID=913969 RepID=A0A8H9FV63_9MICO|nr:RNA polymerase sigma factor SigM [Knoellia flava]KGN35241.1 RNA polymerase sigma factor SigM [Knoellia flava TL1]GGB90383.1 RNA polymerase sigma factor SigM [Knoellia flava]
MDGLEDASDRALMARHLEGDPDAFGEIFRRHRDRLWAVAVRTTNDRELAADCVQDGFVNAFRRAASYRGDAAVSTWLHRIVVNACLDRLRRERDVLRRAGDVADIDVVDRHDRHGEAETGLDVRAALAALPEHQRLALVLVDMHGMPVAEAAEVLEVAVGTVKSRCARGREALAALLADSGLADGRREPRERA